MANENLYPFGGGAMPSGFPIVNDTRTDKANVALSAGMGKYLQDQINQFNLHQTQTYGKIVAMRSYTGGKSVNPSTGEVQDTGYANQFVEEYPIDLVNEDYLASYGTGATQTTYTLNYYDEDWNYLGGAYNKNDSGEVATSLTFAELVFPSSWESDLETYKERAKFIRIVGWTGSRDAILYETWTIPQSVLAEDATPNTIMMFASLVQSPFPYSGRNDNTELSTMDIVSPWGIVFPDTYTVTGNPTPIIAMLHGSDGYVAEGVLGYTDSDWVAMRNAYLAAGFAVMDINGYGVSTEPDEKSKHWGNPLAIETLNKAFTFLRENYNICEKIILHGTSMGGVLAMSFAKTFPGKVLAIGLFAPSVLAPMFRYHGVQAMADAWGYTDLTEASGDGYSKITGFAPINETVIVDSDNGLKKMDWDDYATESSAWDTKPIESIAIPTMVWQGSSDQSYRIGNTEMLVDSLRRGNSPCFLRTCSGAGHDLAGVAYVRNEAVSWFKRFISVQNISE